MENLIYFSAGAVGAFCKDVFQDNKLVLPRIKDGEFFLGFIGGMVIGGLAGIYTDHSFITALFSGFTGASILPSLTAQAVVKISEPDQAIEAIIKMVCKEEMVDPDLAIRVAKCESNLDPRARNINSPTSIDRGLYQINNFYHPSVTDEQADDPIFATRFFCKAFKNGHLDWWKASKKCWDK
jgi:hypothetical protein